MNFLKNQKQETETKMKEMEARALREYAKSGNFNETATKAEKLEKEVREDKDEATVMDKANDIGAKARETVEGTTEKAKEMGTNTIEKAKELAGINVEKTNEVGAEASEKAVGIVETTKEMGANTIEQAKELAGMKNNDE